MKCYGKKTTRKKLNKLKEKRKATTTKPNHIHWFNVRHDEDDEWQRHKDQYDDDDLPFVWFKE